MVLCLTGFNSVRRSFLLLCLGLLFCWLGLLFCFRLLLILFGHAVTPSYGFFGSILTGRYGVVIGGFKGVEPLFLVRTI
jgi:hypothetical protein